MDIGKIIELVEKIDEDLTSLYRDYNPDLRITDAKNNLELLQSEVLELKAGNKNKS